MLNSKWTIEVRYTDGSREVFTDVVGTDLVGGHMLLYIEDSNGESKMRQLEYVERYDAWQNKGQTYSE